MEVSREHKWKCRQHPQFLCDLICLDGDSKDRVMCLCCAQKQLIPISNLISMCVVQSANKDDILEAYPPLKDQELYEKLRKSSLEQQREKIMFYFKKLKNDILNELSAAEQRAHLLLATQEQDNQELLEKYRSISEIEQLKKLIVSERQSAEKDLDSFIKEKWSKAEENRKVLKDLLDRYQDKYNFTSNEPLRLAQDIIERLKAINFEKESITQAINLIKSSLGSSESIEITNVDDSIYQLKQEKSSGLGQVFIDPILNPLQKYVLNIELEIKQGNEGKINFGIMKDDGKDNREGYYQKMCYQDNSNEYGISKQIRGNPMQQSGNIAKRSFEVRICLNEKLLRVASLPDYSSVIELDDPNKIDPKVAYRFFLAMGQKDDIIRITNFRTVRKFDEKL